MMNVIEILDDFMCAYDIRATLESNGEGGIDIMLEYIGGQVDGLLCRGFCDSDENLADVLKRVIDNARAELV